MNNFFERDLGSILLSIAIILGWLGIGFVFLRVLAVILKNILEKIFKDEGGS